MIIFLNIKYSWTKRHNFCNNELKPNKNLFTSTKLTINMRYNCVAVFITCWSIKFPSVTLFPGVHPLENVTCPSQQLVAKTTSNTKVRICKAKTDLQKKSLMCFFFRFFLFWLTPWTWLWMAGTCTFQTGNFCRCCVLYTLSWTRWCISGDWGRGEYFLYYLHLCIGMWLKFEKVLLFSNL